MVIFKYSSRHLAVFFEQLMKNLFIQCNCSKDITLDRPCWRSRDTQFSGDAMLNVNAAMATAVRSSMLWSLLFLFCYCCVVALLLVWYWRLAFVWFLSIALCVFAFGFRSDFFSCWFRVANIVFSLRSYWLLCVYFRFAFVLISCLVDFMLRTWYFRVVLLGSRFTTSRSTDDVRRWWGTVVAW